MNTYKTNYAKGELVSREVLEKQVKYFADMKVMSQAFDSTNILVAILNSLRQIVYVNKEFIKALKVIELKSILGKRPGEVMCCKHASENKLGCGDSEACKYCNAVNLILSSIQSGEEATGEAVIVGRVDGFEESMNFQEHVVPFRVEEEDFYILSLVDITDTVKARYMQRIFFHDVINTAGALGNYVGLLKNEVPESIRDEMEFVEETFKDMVSEIQWQRLLIEAENGELKPHYSEIQSFDVLSSVKKLYERNGSDKGRVVAIDEKFQCILFTSDYVILKRVLSNMIKNALEETEAGGTVYIGCKRLEFQKKQHIEFWVKNEKYMPTEIQHQVFNRAFSTKGIGRGLGTYSMKLLGERYLGGMVGFVSDKSNGTLFYVRLPLE